MHFRLPIVVAAAVAAVAVLMLPVAASAEPTFPALTGRVVDEANVIPADIEASLTAKLAALEAATTDQFVVVTLSSLQGYEIADYGFRLGRAWGIGQEGKDNGVLLIVAPNERAVRFEVGYGLEGELTDALTRVIIENAILPRFRADDIGGGIERGVDDAIQVIKGDAVEIQNLADQREADDSIWATILPFLIIVAFIIVINLLSRRRGWGWLAGTGAGSSWSSGGRSWGGGGGSSGGGFSGGGGSFGGGGSSGRW